MAADTRNPAASEMEAPHHAPMGRGADAPAGRGAHGHEAHGEHGGHASVGFYWLIGGILAILTAMEVAAFYMELGAFEAPFLLALSAAKFVLVVMFFMHLKFDHKILTVVFMAGLVLAAFMITGLIILYHLLPRYGG